MGLKEGQIDSGRYELPVSDKKKTCQRQNNRQNIRSRILKRLMAITAFPSSSFNRCFLHQYSQSPTKSMDYNFVPF
jgi:hypothetical protein